MCHRTRQESTTPRLRFSYDLTVARSQVKVTFANTHLPRAVLFAHHEHTITPIERSSRTIRTWFRSDSDLLEHREHEYSRFIVRLELEVIYSNKTNTTIYTNMAFKPIVVKNNRWMKKSTGAPCTHGASPRVPTTGATKDIGLTAIIRLVARMLHCAPNEHCSQI